MDDAQKDSESKGPGPEKLLARGSRILGLAVAAFSKGQRSRSGPWYVLSKETVGPAEQVLGYLEEKPSAEVLESVVNAALSPKPATDLPGWAKKLSRDDELLARIGNEEDSKLLDEIFKSSEHDLSPRQMGLASVAIAFCRSKDGLDAVGSCFGQEERTAVSRIGSLASVVVRPGKPTEVRKFIRKLVEKRSGDNDG